MLQHFISESPNLFTYVLLPLFIFFARIADVTLGTFRIIFISRGMKYLSALVGFFEVFIWLLAIGQIFQNLTNILCYFAYAAGFAGGSFLGVYISEKIAIGKVVLRIITARDATQLVQELKDRNYGVTTVEAQGALGTVKMVFSIIPRQSLQDALELVQRCNPKAFYSVEDVRSVSEGIFPRAAGVFSGNFVEAFRLQRKSK
ncbi:MAG: DUF2179 domain-containing protein [Deltaproteobacteria bacterium]|nr:DUF2179 domain-containing protein [Deltaproteobacteria bacterium]